jgi:hypothetical protein
MKVTNNSFLVDSILNKQNSSVKSEGGTVYMECRRELLDRARLKARTKRKTTRKCLFF